MGQFCENSAKEEGTRAGRKRDYPPDGGTPSLLPKRRNETVMAGFEFQNNGVLFGADEADMRILRDGLVAFTQGGGVRAGDVRRRRGRRRDDDDERVALIGGIVV